VFGPGRSDLFGGRELAATCRSFGRRDGLALLIGKHDHARVIAPGKLKNDARNIVLRVGREAAHGFKRFVEQSRHTANIRALGRGLKQIREPKIVKNQRVNSSRYGPLLRRRARSAEPGRRKGPPQ
jgi:hypothetical protein